MNEMQPLRHLWAGLGSSGNLIMVVQPKRMHSHSLNSTLCSLGAGVTCRVHPPLSSHSPCDPLTLLSPVPLMCYQGSIW